MHAQKNNGYIIVEGNIGAGKSTFLALLKKHLDVTILYEPTNMWQNIQGHNLLDYFYKDPKRWSYTFQTYAFVTRVVAQQEASKHAENPLIVERSVYADRYCFAKNAYEMGLMSDLEWSLYTQWFSWLMNAYVDKPIGIIYLETTPETSYKRLLKRNRSEEKTVDIAYIEAIHNKYQDWLINKKDIMPELQNIPLLKVDGNYDFEANADIQQEYMEKVSQFLKNVVSV